MEVNRSHRSILLGVLFILWPSGAAAQVILNGTVMDEAQRPVALATLTLESDPPGTTLEGKTNRDGTVSFVLNRPGRYLLSAVASGFFELKQKPIELVAGLNLVTIDLIAKTSMETSLEVHPVD